MKARALLAAGPVGAALALGLVYALLGHEASRPLLTPENVIGFGAAVTGSVVAARAFSSGDYLRVAWLLMAACYALLLVDTLLFGAANAATQREVSTVEAVTSGVLTITANVATVVALAWVARAWRVAGLDLAVSRGAFVGSMVIALLLSAAIVAPGFLDGVRSLGEGKLDALQGIASSLGDVAAAVLVVPLLLTALSLRGGSLAWPWALLTASTVLWLGVDAIGVIAEALGTSAQTVMPLEEACRFGACLFQLTAGLAQRQAVQSI